MLLYGTSLRKYPNRFKLSLIKSDRLESSRAISIKPKPNYTFAVSQRICLNSFQNSPDQIVLPRRPNTATQFRPSTAKIRQDFEAVVLVSSPRKRPASAMKKVSIRDILN